MIFSWLVRGLRMGVSVRRSPFSSVRRFFTPLKDLVFTVPFWTFTVIFLDSPLFSVTVIFAEPVRFMAVMVQVPSDVPVTFTILVLLDFQEATESPFASPFTVMAEVFCLTFSGMEEAESSMVGVSVFPVVRVSFS